MSSVYADTILAPECPPICLPPAPPSTTVTASAVIISATSGIATNGSFSAVASDGSPLTYATSSSPAHGTLTLSGDSFTYTPDAVYVGPDSFEYTASAGSVTSNTASVSIEVSAPIDVTAPVITPPADRSFTATTFPATLSLVFATATDETDPSPTVSVSATTFSAGTTTVTWTATDASGNSATTTSQVGVFLNVDATEDVPAACDVTDSDGVVHSYEASSPDTYLAICALQAALDSGSVASASLSNQYPSIGLFVTSLSGVAADPNAQYWALYQNGGFASYGLGQLPVAAGDSLMLQLHDFSDTNLGSQVTIRIGSLISTSTATTTDTVAPSFSPATHMFIATSSFGAMPQTAYPTATDDSGATPTITYDPLTLPTGTTTVTWTATDGSGNSSTTTSDVVVFEPFEIDVPASCTIVDTEGTAHTYPGSSSPSDYLGICMLQAAKDAGLISTFEAVNSSFGIYIQSIDGIVPGETEYWAFWENEGYTSTGITITPISEGDTLSFVLTDWMTSTESRGIALHARSLIATSTSPSSSSASSSGGGGGTSHLTFSVQNALAYLVSKQNADGSFSSPMLTDWAALAFAASDPGAAKTKLIAYLKTASPSLSSATDYERHAMALMALGIDPYSGAPVDYISPIVSRFDSIQIGDISLDNDDIFALFPLLHAGYTLNDDIIQKTVAFIVSKQQSNGSWDNSTDITAAAVQALGNVTSLPGVSSALTNARGYLRAHQQSSGGFGDASTANSFTTSWVMQAIAALGESQSSWQAGSNYPSDHLAGLQQSDGGVEPSTADVQSRIWATEYAIPGALGRTWSSLLASFSRPSTNAGGGATNSTQTASAASSAGSATSTTSAASTTPTAASSTPLMATSSPAASTTFALALPTGPTTAPTETQRIVATPTPYVAAVVAAASPTTTSSQVAAAANAVGTFDWWLYLLILFVLLGLIALTSLLYSRFLKR